MARQPRIRPLALVAVLVPLLFATSGSDASEPETFTVLTSVVVGEALDPAVIAAHAR